MESWDDPTESALGAFDDRSLELDIDFSSMPPTRPVAEMSPDGVLAELWPDASRRGQVAPDVVVFDPMGFELARRLRSMGFAVRDASSGVDVMTLVAARPTGAVVCGPAEDAERRRLLTAALRLRFPAVPVVYISTHARNPAAVKGAKAEGAEIVLALPLPSDDEVRAVLGPFSPPARPARLPDPGTGTLRPLDMVVDDPGTLALSAEELAAQQVRYQAFGSPRPMAGTPLLDAPPPVDVPFTDSGVLTPPMPTKVATPRPSAPAAARAAAGFRAAAAPTDRVPLYDEDSALPFDSELPTELVSAYRDDGMPALGAGRDTAPPPKTSPALNGEVGQLLAAISPFLWGLEDAARYVETVSEGGDASALTHARTLKLLGRLLTQLKDRVDDLGI